MKTFLFPNIGNPYIKQQNKVSQKSNISFGTVATLPQEVMPDFKQTLIWSKRKFTCAPVSIANWMVELSKKGFRNLFPSGGDITKLIEELAAILKTDEKGTTMDCYCHGLETFVKAKGYACDVSYEGFRPVSPKYKLANIPNLNWLKNEINQGNATFLNIGSYVEKWHGGQHIFQRKDGHYVTVVGCDNRFLHPEYLTIHDSYAKETGDFDIKVEKIHSGKLVHNTDDNESTLTNDAKGFYQIKTKFNYLPDNEKCIINGIVSLRCIK